MQEREETVLNYVSIVPEPLLSSLHLLTHRKESNVCMPLKTLAVMISTAEECIVPVVLVFGWCTYISCVKLSNLHA